MLGELVSIPTDSDPLDGILTVPEHRRPRAGVLLFHGNTMNFYTGPSRFLPPVLTQLGFACLAFNRRGHDILTTPLTHHSATSRSAAGGAFQTAAEGIADNRWAAGFLADRGFRSPIVIGHSNGGLLGAEFAATVPETRALVLLSAHAGGADTYVRSCATGLMAGDDGQEYLASARDMVGDGRGDELLLMPNWWYAISARSLIDRHENTPDLLECAPRITCPTLSVVGDQESREVYPAEAFARTASGPSDFRIIERCDHWYTDRADEVADVVGGWLDGVMREVG